MKIFISHSTDDEKLAKILKSTLEERKEIDEAFMFEEKRKYGMQIDKKIIDEINQSDYLVAIITKNSKNSASVNQELGYAQAKKIEKIPMIENGAKEGFLVYGVEKIYFSKENFDKQCKSIQNYIVKNGPKRKFTIEEETLVKKSAYYRREMDRTLLDFLDGAFYRLQMGTEQERALLMFGRQNDIQRGFKKIRAFFKQSDKKLIPHFSNISFLMYRKISLEYETLLHEIKEANRFPNTEFFQNESDVLTRMKEHMNSLSSHDLDLEEYAKMTLPQKVTFDFESCFEIMNLPEYHHNLKNYLGLVISDLRDVVLDMVDLLEIYIDYRKKFGNIAFRSQYDK